MTVNQRAILAEAIKGWKDPSPEAQRRREAARRRAWAVRNGTPWRIDEIATEIELLWGTDSVESICRRLNYGKPESLLRRLRRNGYDKLATKLENALIRSGAIPHTRQRQPLDKPSTT